MGFDSISVMNATTPFHNLVEQGLVDEPIFSFYMPHDQQGELTIGTLAADDAQQMN
jgi:saccharopepsin